LFINYFQLAALTLFVLLVMERTAHIALRDRINPIRLSLQRNGARHVIVLVLFISVNIWSLSVVMTSLSWSEQFLPAFLRWRLIDATILRLLGMLLVVLGFGIFILALRHLGDSWRLGIDEKTPGKLVTTGIYALSRNPVYVFFDLYFLGTFLINGMLLFLLFFALVAVILHYQILQEERFLARTYGAEYEAYRASTGRYVTLSPLPALARARRERIAP
jgi:protein-S-isoprenylcysteine O-methyltransferase Ste14